MSRIQLALNVSDVDEAVRFYSKLFATEPAKRKPGYANFAIAEPPLKLVLIEAESGGTLNHLGVEVESTAQVEAAEERLASVGLATTGMAETTCCYADKTETWAHDPDGAPWEFYVKIADADQLANSSRSQNANVQCCVQSNVAPGDVKNVDAAAATTEGCC